MGRMKRARGEAGYNGAGLDASRTKKNHLAHLDSPTLAGCAASALPEYPVAVGPGHAMDPIDLAAEGGGYRSHFRCQH
eukprot:COSAG05_NODE_18_length_34957_cov_44.338115_23_plen_78_part_00